MPTSKSLSSIFWFWNVLYSKVTKFQEKTFVVPKLLRRNLGARGGWQHPPGLTGLVYDAKSSANFLCNRTYWNSSSNIKGVGQWLKPKGIIFGAEYFYYPDTYSHQILIVNRFWRGNVYFYPGPSSYTFRFWLKICCRLKKSYNLASPWTLHLVHPFIKARI